MRALRTIVLLAFLTAPTLLNAGTNDDPARAACKEKIEQVCPGVQPGGGRIKDCLKQHNTTLKEICPNVVSTRHTGANAAPDNGATTMAPTAQAPQDQ